MRVVGEGARDGFPLGTGQLLPVQPEGGWVDEVGEHGDCLETVLHVEGEWVACSHGTAGEGKHPTETDSQTDRQTERHADRQTDTQTDRQTGRDRQTQINRWTDRQTDRQADR